MDLPVLVADDDDAMRSFVARAVAGLGRWTILARGARELEEQGRGAVAAVVSDIELGDGNGLDVCRRLRRDRPRLPIVLMTGGWTEAERARAAGLGPVLRKPFTLEELEAALLEALGPR